MEILYLIISQVLPLLLMQLCNIIMKGTRKSTLFLYKYLSGQIYQVKHIKQDI